MTAQQEPEEIIEAHVVAALAAANPGVPVEGMLAPVDGDDEKLSAPSRVTVAVDLSTQDLDWVGPGVPCSYSLRAAVRLAAADDSSGVRFRDACRMIRAALAAFTGDGCAALDGDGFHCDAFVMGATSTSFMMDSDDGAFVKTYSATIHGRFIPTTTETEAENG